MDKPRRYSITMDEELFHRIEDFRFSNRFQSRNEATLTLIKLGIEAIEKKQAEEKTEAPDA